MGCNGSFQAHLFEFRVVGYRECSRIFWLGVVNRKPESETVRRCSLADPSGLEAGEPPRKPSRMRAIEKPVHLTRTSVLNAVKCARWYGVVACWLILAQGLTSQAATLSTDRLDYPPFSDVYIDGAGWAPGETVSVHLDEVEPNGTRTPVWDADPAPIADTTGSFTVEWFIWSDEFLGATLEVTPFVGTEDARDHVERNKLFGAALAAIDDEGDAEPAEKHVRLVAPAADRLGRQPFQPLIEIGNDFARRAVGQIPLVERRHRRSAKVL